MANFTRPYGFEWDHERTGNGPELVEYRVATGKAFAINGGAVTTMDLNIGDPVTLLNTEYLDIAEGSEASGGTADAVLGIVMGITWYWDAAGQKMVPASKLPSSIAWGTVQARASIVQVALASSGVWRVKCDEAATATTYQAYRAFMGEACDHVLTEDAATKLFSPRLDISTHSASSGQWQIVDVPNKPVNQDFSLTNVVLWVRGYEMIGGTQGVLV